MTQYFTGKGYGVSDLTDLSGRPLLTYQGPGDSKPILLSDRCAVTFDPTIKQVVNANDLHTPRLDDALSAKIKQIVGGVTDDELDHKIALELGGSNLPANLMIQPGRTGGQSAASDTVETTLAARVAAGQVSLQTAWAALAQQKGFLLGEDSPTGVQFSFGSALADVTKLVGDIAINFPGRTKGTIASETQAQIDQNKAILKDNPFNLKARQTHFEAQILALSTKTGVGADESGAALRAMLSAYSETSGVDKREVINTLTAVEQRLLQVSKTPPTILGIESQSLIKMLLAIAGLNIIAAISGVVLIVVGMIIAGPEELIGAGIGFSLSGISTAFGLNIYLGLGVTLTALAGVLTGISFFIGFDVKEYYDNAVLAPTQQITAFKDALGIEKTLGTGLQMAAATGKVLGGSSPSSTSGASSAGSGGGGGNVKLFTGVIANGTLGASNSFTPNTSNLISNAGDLKSAAKHNLAAYVVALPGLFYWDIAIVNTIKSATGFTIHGSIEKVQIGTTKTGTPKYKTYYQKFAVLRVGIKDMSGRSIKLTEVDLGPVDSTSFSPTSSDLAGVSAALTPELFTSDVSQVQTLVTSSPVTVQHPLSPTDFSIALANGTIKTQADVNAVQGSAPVAAAPAPAPVVVAPPPPPPPPAAVPTTRLLANAQFHVHTPGTILNVRSSPGINASIVQKFPDGTLVRLDQVTIPNVPVKVVQMDGYNWVAVVGVNDPYNAYGWVASEYLV